MRRLLAVTTALAALLAVAGPARAAQYEIDPIHSHVIFAINHLGFAKMIGFFTGFSGVIGFDPANVAASKLAVTIQTDSLQTQFAQRDKDLKGADWLNVTEFPEMTFTGTSYTKKDDHSGTVTGNLTLHGVTKPVTLEVVVNKVGQNPLMKKDEAGFSAHAVIKRSDFGIKTYIPAIGDDVDLTFEIEAYAK